MRAKLTYGLAVVLALGALGVGCGSGKECGEGTIEVDGRCVPEDVISCGTGTVLDMTTGTCVSDVDPVTCGPGTTLDEATGTCEPDVTCATGTVAMGGECVPDGSVICRGNTRFDMATGTCVVGDGVCGDGTVLVMGECVPFDDTLIGMIHAGSEPDDPVFFDGTATTFTPPAIGSTVTIDGCITPADFDGDDEMTIDFDVDFFDFTVSTPGLYDMRIDGRNGLSAAFAVLSPDPALGGWIRIGLDLTNDGASRQVYLPREGQYYIAIFDSRSAALDSLADGLAMARPVGSAETCYFMSIEAIATPAPTALTSDVRTGRLGDPQFFTTTATGSSVFVTTLEAPSPAAQPGVVLAQGTTFHAQNGASPQAFAVSQVVADGAALTIVVDSVFDYSLMPVDYTLRIGRPGMLPADAVATVPHTNGLYSFLWFEGTAGDVVHLTAGAGTARIAFDVINPAFDTIVAAICTLGAPCTSADTWVQLTQTGRYVVRLYNTTGTDGMPYDVAFTRDHVVPTALTLGTPSMLTLDDGWAFAAVDASSVEWGRFGLSGLMGTGFTTAEVRVFARNTAGILRLGTTGAVAPLETATTGTGFSRIWGTAPGAILIAVRDTSGWAGDESLSLALTEETFQDITLMPDVAVMRPGVAIAAGGSAFYLLRADAGSSVSVTVTGTAGADPSIALLDRTATATATVDSTGAGGTEVLTRTMGATGWLAVAVRAGAAGGTVDLSVIASPPPYTIETGTRTFTDICAAGGTEVLNDDDAITPVRVHGLTTFQYFGSLAPRMRIDTNGWLTMDDTYAGGSLYTGSIPATAAPNAVIAPHWADGISQVCVRQTPAEVVVQWIGEPWSPTPTGAIQIEMQAILYPDGRIEFVYGPRHTIVATTGRVGLESRAGDFAILPPLSMVGPGRAIRFVPN